MDHEQMGDDQARVPLHGCSFTPILSREGIDMSQRTPEQIIGKDALLQLIFEGYKVEPMSPLRCEGCDQNFADPPSKLCPGYQAYRDHQS